MSSYGSEILMNQSNTPENDSFKQNPPLSNGNKLQELKKKVSQEMNIKPNNQLIKSGKKKNLQIQIKNSHQVIYQKQSPNQNNNNNNNINNNHQQKENQTKQNLKKQLYQSILTQKNQKINHYQTSSSSISSSISPKKTSFLQKYVLLDYIGEGAHGIVRKCKLKEPENLLLNQNNSVLKKQNQSNNLHFQMNNSCSIRDNSNQCQSAQNQILHLIPTKINQKSESLVNSEQNQNPQYLPFPTIMEQQQNLEIEENNNINVNNNSQQYQFPSLKNQIHQNYDINVQKQQKHENKQKFHENSQFEADHVPYKFPALSVEDENNTLKQNTETIFNNVQNNINNNTQSIISTQYNQTQKKQNNHKNSNESLQFNSNNNNEQIDSRKNSSSLRKNKNNNKDEEEDSPIFAVKIVRSNDEEIIMQVQKTYKLQKILNSVQFMCKTYELYIDDNSKYLYQVMEYVSWPSLRTLLKEKKQIPENQCKKIIKSLCKAVYEMHKRGISHRDLKPDNIMVNPNDYSQIKIIDFGIARKFIQREDKFNDSKIEMWTMTGTPQYKAPEMFHFGYTEYVDNWAIGVITYELLSGTIPFTSELQMDLVEEIQSCNFKFMTINNSDSDFSWDNNNKLAKDFILRLMKPHDETSKRLSAENAMNHLWLGGMDNKNKIQDDISVRNEISFDQDSSHNTADLDKIDQYQQFKNNQINYWSFSVRTPTIKRKNDILEQQKKRTNSNNVIHVISNNFSNNNNSSNQIPQYQQIEPHQKSIFSIQNNQNIDKKIDNTNINKELINDKSQENSFSEVEKDRKLYSNFQDENQNEEDEEDESNIQVRSRARTKSMIKDFMADNNDVNVHRTQPNTPNLQPLFSPISQITLNERIRDRKNSVKQHKTPQTSDSEINTPLSCRLSQLKQSLIINEKNKTENTQNDLQLDSEQNPNLYQLKSKFSLENDELQQNSALKKSGYLQDCGISPLILPSQSVNSISPLKDKSLIKKYHSSTQQQIFQKYQSNYGTDLIGQLDSINDEDNSSQNEEEQDIQIQNKRNKKKNLKLHQNLNRICDIDPDTEIKISQFKSDNQLSQLYDKEQKQNEKQLVSMNILTQKIDKQTENNQIESQENKQNNAIEKLDSFSPKRQNNLKQNIIPKTKTKAKSVIIKKNNNQTFNNFFLENCGLNEYHSLQQIEQTTLDQNQNQEIIDENNDKYTNNRLKQSKNQDQETKNQHYNNIKQSQ
ncbi:Protein kinase-like domain [Pseudocohnilembus persalinus]|uniref:Protein kinase-like domain n=1 Tax=Pseudocohnilembus persalinus TaxID=266149 RepID=A0A0V0QAS4_PSEPJ|nr:Protein kinase-like domain [Pseudocohnilembus persalinus]|eukprot:KRW99334.1 Protein kinase-like domain [Pseudocohnilembus persalinus]